MKTIEQPQMQSQISYVATPNTRRSTINGLLTRIIILVLVLCIGATSLLYVYSLHVDSKNSKKATNISVTFLESKLEAVSDLTTAKLIHTGMINFSDGKIPLISKKTFVMEFTATVEAGIDLSKAEFNITDTHVSIALPEISIMDVSVDSSSLKFYDQKLALFNWKQNDDTVQAIKAAEEQVLSSPKIDELYATARNQLETLLHALFDDQIGDRTLVISYYSPTIDAPALTE